MHISTISLEQKYKVVYFVISLALVPPEKISDGFANLLDITPDYDILEQFNDYFVEQWLENRNHTISM